MLTYLGGSCGDSATGIAIDRFNNAYIVGNTTSTDLPLSNSLQRYGGEGDAFFARIIETELLQPAPVVQSVTQIKAQARATRP